MEKIVQTAGRNALGEFAPEFAHYNDDVLFGENWNNHDIDLKIRCMLTITALMAQGITDSSMKHHLENAKAHGVTQKEIAALITHVAFYAGWPKAWAVFQLAKEVWETKERVRSDETYKIATREEFEKEDVFGIGAPNEAYAQYFIGNSFLKPVTDIKNGGFPMFHVTFEPGCRNNWHIHHAKTGGGQVLICTYGEGWYQQEGKDAVRLIPGTVITIPANVKHWHGAKKDSWFSHLTFEPAGEETSNEWCEPVSDEEYSKL